MYCDLWPYVWLVFKSGFYSRSAYDGARTVVQAFVEFFIKIGGKLEFFSIGDMLVGIVSLYMRESQRCGEHNGLIFFLKEHLHTSYYKLLQIPYKNRGI